MSSTSTLWKSVGVKLASAGLPILARVLLGRVPLVGGALANAFSDPMSEMITRALARTLGVPHDPEAVATALETQDTSTVVGNLRALEAEVTARWPALASMNASDNEAEVKLAEVTSHAYNDRLRLESAIAIGTNDYWPTFYRTLVNWFAMAHIPAGGFILFYALIYDPSLWERMIQGQTLLSFWFGGIVLTLLGHYTTRASERKAATGAIRQQTSPAAT